MITRLQPQSTSSGYRTTSRFAMAHLTFTAALAAALAIPRVVRVGRAIADDVDTQLDERQVALRNAASLDAFRVVATSLLLGIIWVALGVDKSLWWVPKTYNEWNMVFWGAIVMTLALPSAFLAWREPDRVDDREEDEQAHA